MRNYARYAFGVMLLVIAIIFIVVLFNLVRNILAGGEQDRQQPQNSQKVDLLAVPSKDQAVQYSVSGPVVGREEHRSIRIKIDRDTRTFEVLRGYGNEVIKSQETPNTLEAYEAFIAALNGAGFTNSVAPEGRGQELQSCPLGRIYSYEIEPGTRDSFRTWSNSCSSKKEGTFTGNNKVIQTLFQRQIPNYNKLTSDVRLG